jgi:hypothetical protein
MPQVSGEVDTGFPTGKKMMFMNGLKITSFLKILNATD